jgi:hypothetical protein
MLQLALYSRPRLGRCARCGDRLAEHPFIVRLNILWAVHPKSCVASYRPEAHAVCYDCVQLHEKANYSAFKCPGCNRDFHLQADLKDVKACGPVCKRRVKQFMLRASNPQTCQWCSKRFITGVKWRRFCSSACKQQFNLKDRPRVNVMQTKVCEGCGSTFETKYNDKRFCTSSCSERSGKERRKKSNGVVQCSDRVISAGQGSKPSGPASGSVPTSAEPAAATNAVSPGTPSST